MDKTDPFKWRHYESTIIVLCVRWYLRYSLSYRDLKEMMQERGLKIAHTTIYRWVQSYAAELEKRVKPYPGLGFWSFHTAWRTLRGYEVMNSILNGQVEEAAKGRH